MFSIHILYSQTRSSPGPGPSQPKSDEAQEVGHEEGLVPSQVAEAKDSGEVRTSSSKKRDDKKEAKRGHVSRPESPFHKSCRPEEPSRDFFAKPAPKNILTQGPPVRARSNGKMRVPGGAA